MAAPRQAQLSLDQHYFAAIEAACQGSLDLDVVKALFDEALKFATLEMTAEATRFYERLFQICLTWQGSYQVTENEQPIRAKQLLLAALRQYQSLLEALGRKERAAALRSSIDKLCQNTLI
jgi:hypothetical protein